MPHHIKLKRLTGNRNRVIINNYYGIQPEQLQAILKSIIQSKINNLSNDNISGSNNFVHNTINYPAA